MSDENQRDENQRLLKIVQSSEATPQEKFDAMQEMRKLNTVRSDDDDDPGPNNE